jgi:raffinose/stachyose/melibiose transport system substrate-binding protein
MKKTLLWIVILAISISMVATFSFVGCKKEAEEVATEEAAVEEAAVEEEAVAAEEAPSDVVGTLTIWDMEVDNAFSASWDFAREEFKAKYPKVTVQYEMKTFEQMQETGKMILSSDDVPDVMQCNKGSATAGMYASEGLLTDLTAEAEARGWIDIMSPSFQTTCRYNDKGIMGSGNLYGVTNYGEFVMVYYNKDMFTEYNVEVPTSLAEFEAVCDKFVCSRHRAHNLRGA